MTKLRRDEPVNLAILGRACEVLGCDIGDIMEFVLNGKDDVRPSYYLEDVVTEFDIQGLELDYSIVARDAEYRFENGEWTYNNFVDYHRNNVNFKKSSCT